MLSKKLIVICGATASGKTNLAIQVAQHFNTEILSFDSRQCYKELTIGVARPSNEELTAVLHHFITSHSIHDNVNAAAYEKYALQVVENLFKKYDTVVAVGGTGLYLQALCNGVDEIPTIPETLRSELKTNYEKNGLNWLQHEIQKNDTNYTTANDLGNVQRMLRALEVVLHTGKTISSFHNKPKANRNFEIKKFAIDIDRAALYERINSRVIAMLQHGLLKEVETLLPHKNLNALQTVGYTELFDFIEGKTNLATATTLIQQHTRNYAKRQLTWFRREPEIFWVKNLQQLLENLL